MKQKPTPKKLSLKKLSLKKETIAELSSDKMNGVKGGLNSIFAQWCKIIL